MKFFKWICCVAVIYAKVSLGQVPNFMDDTKSFSDSTTKVWAKELNQYLALPYSPKNDSLVNITFGKIFRNNVWSNQFDDILKFAEIRKKYANERKDKYHLLAARQNEQYVYVSNPRRNPLKAHTTALEQLKLLEDYTKDKRNISKVNHITATVVRYFLTYYAERDEIELAKSFLEKYKNILLPKSYEALTKVIKKEKPTPRANVNTNMVKIREFGKDSKDDFSNLWMYHQYIAEAYNQLNMPDSAIYYTGKAFEISKMPKGNAFPTDPKAPEEIYYETMARALYFKKEYEKAHTYLQKLPSICNTCDPEFIRLKYNVFKAVGKDAEALTAFENLTKMQKKDDSLKRLKSVEYLQIGFETERVRLEEQQKQLVQKQLADSVLNIKGIALLQALNRQQLLEKETILKNLSFEKLQASSFKQTIENQSIKSLTQQQQSEIKQLKISELNQQLESQNRTRNFLGMGMVLLALLGGVLLWNSRKLKAKNIVLNRKNQEISEALVKGQTIERKRVASELHDNLGALLAALKMATNTLDIHDLHPQEQEIYGQMVSMIDDANRQVRSLAHNLLPDELEKVGLLVSLEKLITKLNIGQKTQFDLQVTGLTQRLDRKTEFNLYTIILELCNNIIKHANAKEASVELIQTDSHLQLLVSDDGEGFDAATNKEAGMGLKNLHERAEAIRATVRVLSEKGEGTVVSLKFTLTSHSEVQTS